MARLYVLSGDLIGRTFDVEGEVVVGRAEDADVPLRARSVSRRHARLKPLGAGRWRVEDLGSSNGTFVEGVRVDDAVVGDGDVFALGDVEVRLRDAEVAAAAADGAPEEAPAGSDGAGDGELELEFDDDIDAAIESAPRPAPGPRGPDGPGASGRRAAPRRRAPAGGAAAPSAGAAATRDRAARRATAMGGARRGPAVEDSGRPILQYAETRSGGTDVSQIGGLGRVLLVLFAIALVGGVAYAAFWMTQAGRAG